MAKVLRRKAMVWDDAFQMTLERPGTRPKEVNMERVTFVPWMEHICIRVTSGSRCVRDVNRD